MSIELTPQSPGPESSTQQLPRMNFDIISSIEDGYESDYDESALQECDPDFQDLEDNGPPKIPFTSIHNCHSLPAHQMAFLSGQRVDISIIDVTTQPSRNNMMSPYLYTIQVRHAGSEWTVKRRFKHFRHLHKELVMYRTKLRMPVSSDQSESHAEKRLSARKNGLPTFPKKPDSFISSDDIQSRKELLEKYLQHTIRCSLYRNHPEMLKFLEVSHLSFVANLGGKGKEGRVLKLANTEKTEWWAPLWRKTRAWTKRWFAVEESFVLYLREDNTIGNLLLMDKYFQADTDPSATGKPNGIRISNSSRHLTLDCETPRRQEEWMNEINKVTDTTARDFIQENRFESFVPVREDSYAQWFVHGAAYMHAVSTALDLAKEEIFLTSWWLTPELFLRRPIKNENDPWRLDNLLEKKAAQGVKIYILLDNSPSSDINTMYAKQTLMKKHPENIKILRDPDLTKTSSSWVHNEKTVVIDQKIAFVGSSDLCWGRWDDEKHRLTDVGTVVCAATLDPSHFIPALREEEAAKAAETENKENEKSFKEQTSGTQDADDPQEGSATLERGVDIGEEISGTEERGIDTGEPVIDTADSGVLPAIPNHQTSDGSTLDRKKRSQEKELQKSTVSPKKLARNSVLEEDGLIRNNIATENKYTMKYDTIPQDVIGKLWIGKDYVNTSQKTETDLDQPFCDILDRQTQPRMPIHDVSAVVYGRVARDVARHFIQRWNAAKMSKAKDVPFYPFLVPKSYQHVNIATALKKMAVQCQCQILRSVSEWSAGQSHTESSIHEAYLQTINSAKYFIYIEGEYFVSATSTDDSLSNRIADALYNRIIKAHRVGETFRVYLVLPLSPEKCDVPYKAEKQDVDWNVDLGCKEVNALKTRLAKNIEDPSDYFTCCGLRTYGELNGKLVSETIYVHSNLLIADDSTVILGSAKIQDRNMMGPQDSEMAVIVEDTEFVDAYMNGEPYQAGKFAHSLRTNLFREYLGSQSDVDVTDPVVDSFYKSTWGKQASVNTATYERVFRPIPNDSIRKMDQLADYKRINPLCESSPHVAKGLLKKMRGFLVQMPLQFLSEEGTDSEEGNQSKLI